MEDTFIRDYVEDLLKKIRTQVSPEGGRNAAEMVGRDAHQVTGAITVVSTVYLLCIGTVCRFLFRAWRHACFL